MSATLFGFDSEKALRAALQRLDAESIREGVEVYTPMPLDEGGPSPLPLVMFVAGMLGFVGFFLLMTYADERSYPLDIGGRPAFAWPTFIPIAFELGVLCAMAAGFFGFFILCRLPRLYETIDECDSFRNASRDGWFVAVHSDDPARAARVGEVLAALHPASREEIPA